MSSSDINNDPYAQHHQLYQQHQQNQNQQQQYVDNHSHNSNSNNHGHSHGHHRNQIGHAQPYYSTYNQLNNSGGISAPTSYNNNNNQYNNNNMNNQYNNYSNSNNNSNNGYFSMDKNSSSGITLNNLLNNLNRDSDAKKLAGWIFVMLLFTLYEIFYGAYLESLGLVSDGFHALFDCIGLCIALLGMLVSKKGSNSEYTYGYDRWEVLGTFSNGAFLVFVSFFLFLESIERLLEPPHIHSHGRVISLATISLLINIIGFIFFKQRKNRKSTSIRNENLITISQHILIDSFTSLGVIISSIVGSTFGLEISDSLISIVIACVIVYNAVPICIKTSGILLQKTPEPLILNIGNALKDVAVMNGVIEIKEKHFWSHSIGNNVGTLLISVKKNCDESYLLDSIRNRLSFIQDLTIQLDANSNHDHHHHNDEQKSNKHSHSHSHDHQDHQDHDSHIHDHSHHDHSHHNHDHSHHDHDQPIPLYQVQQTPITSPPTATINSNNDQPNNYNRYNNNNNIPTSPIPLYQQNDNISDEEEDNDPYHHHGHSHDNDPYHHNRHQHNDTHHHGHSHDNDDHHGHAHNH